MNGISVIICCYNSALRIPLALENLAKQKTAADLNWEIILVNNNCKDNTVEVALNTWNLLAFKKQLNIIKEDKAGLSFAREAGVKKALYNIILFCDDDNLLAENYLQYAYDLVKKTQKHGYGIWGGKPIAYFDADAIVPEWFEDNKANYVVGQQANSPGNISNRGYIWGAGMVILRKIFLNIINDSFPVLLRDRTGSNLTSGGDSEISLRTLIIGFKLYYDPNLLLKHYISTDKLTPEYNAGLKKGFEQAYPILNKYSIFIHYVSGRNFLLRNYYSFIFLMKYILDKMGLRKLTDFDVRALCALFDCKQFHDMDFDLMRCLLKVKVHLTPINQK